MVRPVTRTRLGIAVLVLAGLLGVAAVALGRHGGSGHEGREPRAVTTLPGGAHPVAGSFRPDETLLASCDEAGVARCYEQAFGNLAYYEGPERAFADFDEALRTNELVKGDCHRIVHMIGSASLARFKGDVAKAFAAGSAACWSGYYHGILERAFADASSPEEVKAVSRTICESPEMARTSFLLYQCVHGLGHGLMIYSGYDLPWALEVCDALETDWDQTSCTGGVFMENISSSYGVKSRWVRDDDPVYPCADMQERHKLYCYLMVTSRINELNGYDWKKTAATCRAVEHAWVTTCFESYGRDVSGQTVEDPVQMAPLCELARRYASACVFGAVRDLASYDPTGRRAASFCAVVRRGLRERCWNGFGTIVATLNSGAAEQRAGCRTAPAAYRSACRLGAGIA